MWAELRRAGDVSPLIHRDAHNQGIDIPRSPKTNLISAERDGYKVRNSPRDRR